MPTELAEVAAAAGGLAGEDQPVGGVVGGCAVGRWHGGLADDDPVSTRRMAAALPSLASVSRDSKRLRSRGR